MNWFVLVKINNNVSLANSPQYQQLNKIEVYFSALSQSMKVTAVPLVILGLELLPFRDSAISQDMGKKGGKGTAALSPWPTGGMHPGARPWRELVPSSCLTRAWGLRNTVLRHLMEGKNRYWPETQATGRGYLLTFPGKKSLSF